MIDRSGQAHYAEARVRGASESESLRNAAGLEVGGDVCG